MTAPLVATTDRPFQLLPPLTVEQRDLLRQSIKENGVLEPVVFDEDGEILDGHHRVEIAEELGIEYPRRVIDDLDRPSKHMYALTVNVARRQLDHTTRGSLVAQMRIRGLSIRRIAEVLGVSRGTVANDIAQLSNSGQLEQPERITGVDGKDRPASRPARPEPEPTQTPEPAAAPTAPVAGSGTTSPAPEPECCDPGPYCDDLPGCVLATAAGDADPRPWCGAAAELGGQQPCPIEEPCPAGTCTIGDDAGPDEEEIGSEYRTDPAERIAAVAEAAPEFVKPVDPEPAPKPTLTLVPDADEKRAAEQRDARALLRRIVDLAAPSSWDGDNVEAWIEHMGPYDDELAELTRRAADAIAVLDRVIEEAGR